jgi:pimeloyl-ACP methyl ester carboxylesterase
MSRWRRLTKASGLAVGVAAAGAGAVIAVEKIAVGRMRLRPDPAAGEPLGQLRGRPLTVLADDGTALHVEISGPDDAPATIIFSHGYTLNQDVWHYQRQGLADAARLVFWDQRGHGRTAVARPKRGALHGTASAGAAPGAAGSAGPASVAGDSGGNSSGATVRGGSGPDGAAVERPAPERVSIDQLGADLGAVLAATAPGDGPVILVGHSMGGMTIMALADQQPELFGPKVVGTVLISTAASGIDPAAWLPPPLRPVIRQATPSVLRGASQGRPAALIELGRQAAGDIAFLTTKYIAFGDSGVSPTVVDFLERIIRATPVEVVADFYLALTEHDKRAALNVLGRVPSVVLIGDRDRLVSTRLAGEVAAGIPGADLILVAGAGHLVILERAGLVNEAILGVLARALDQAGTEPRTA